MRLLLYCGFSKVSTAEFFVWLKALLFAHEIEDGPNARQIAANRN